MAKIVIAGSADCPYYAKSELLADTLVQNLTDFKLHKIVVQPKEWKDWLSQTCAERGWTHTRSPLVWRELVDRGGKGMIIGGANEFQEYAKAYYNVESSFTSDDMRKIATENLHTKHDVDEEMDKLWEQSQPEHICLTCATSPVAYNVISAIAQGEALGDETEVVLHLHDSTAKQEALQGIAMEAFDLACHLLRDVKVLDDLAQALSSCSTIVILDEVVQDMEEETTDDWIKRNYELFSNYGKVINEAANKNVKVIVAGNGPVNFNTWTIIHHAPNIPRQNIVALSRMVENSAKGILSQRLQVNSAGLDDVIVWGSINGMNYIDVQHGKVHGYDGAIWGPPSYSRPVIEMVHDNKWLSTEFLEAVSHRKQKSDTSPNHAHAGSMAASIATLLSHWTNGAAEGRIYSLGVFSEGWYDLPSDLVYSLPVTFTSKGNWTIVPDLEISAEVKAKLQDITKELIAEKDVIFAPPKPPTPPAEVYDSDAEAEAASEKADQETDEKKESQGTEQTENVEAEGELAAVDPAEDPTALTEAEATPEAEGGADTEEA